MKQLPESTTDRHCLSGPFLITERAQSLVDDEDELLRWFNKPGNGRCVGDDVVIPGTGLRALFWYDEAKPNGQCFGVTIYAAKSDPEDPRLPAMQTAVAEQDDGRPTNLIARNACAERVLRLLPKGASPLAGYHGGSTYCIGVPVKDVGAAFMLGFSIGLHEVGTITSDAIGNELRVVFRDALVAQGATPAPAQLNRRPFRITEDGFMVSGRRCFDVAVAESLFDAEREQAERITNDRFEQYLVQAESLGKIDARKYEALVESFIEIVVKSCCTTAD